MLAVTPALIVTTVPERSASIVELPAPIITMFLLIATFSKKMPPARLIVSSGAALPMAALIVAHAEIGVWQSFASLPPELGCTYHVVAACATGTGAATMFAARMTSSSRPYILAWRIRAFRRMGCAPRFLIMRVMQLAIQPSAAPRRARKPRYFIFFRVSVFAFVERKNRYTGTTLP